MKNKLIANGEFVSINGHNLHVFRTGDSNKPKLVFLSGSSTVAPVFDFKVLYSKLVSDFRIIVIEKYGYGYSDLYETNCDVDNIVSIFRKALEEIRETGPFILVSHSMAGLEAVRWKQKYPEEVVSIIGLDMALPATYFEWSEEIIGKKIAFMKKTRRLIKLGLLSWYPLNSRDLNREERKQQRLLWNRNGMNECFINEAKAVLNNAKIVDEAGIIECPALLFVSNGKQVSPNWLKQQHDFADIIGAELVPLDCGHYVHHFESELISNRIKSFL